MIQTWFARAACLGQDTNIFFPPTEQGKGTPDSSAAKAFCDGCPVKNECLDHAINRRIGDGIWGGMGELERRRERERRREATLSRNSR